MLLTSKPSNDPAITTKHQSLAKYLRLFMPSGKSFSTLALLAAIMASPLYAQAALPAAIQAALGRADLTAADISIVIN